MNKFSSSVAGPEHPEYTCHHLNLGVVTAHVIDVIDRTATMNSLGFIAMTSELKNRCYVRGFENRRPYTASVAGPVCSFGCFVVQAAPLAPQQARAGPFFAI